ncbi:MAG TPA: ATP-grasp domain-containing protein [Candidatus Moranbacteria bacterium]|nr:ATP-grasp domain-containing protein [Candidatus Moranbacteria bacterium]HRY27988.1 ATP-grasp domain-containing protein [Candidatus Moranbacteria bacterium]HSA08196.1 ATP-grasp domain-containing protein [Candidatus Moranbacteria bacterium]
MIKNPPVIKKVVLAMGGVIEEFMPERGCFYINIKGKRIFIERKISINRQSFGSVRMSKCKDITHKLLREQGLPTPETECFYNKTYNRKDANEKLKRLDYPIILKDAQGSNSKGIFPFVYDEKEAIAVLENYLSKYKSMIAQQMVFGKEFRLLVLGEKIIGALEMIPPYVVGDGVSTVEKLIKEKQLNTERQTDFDEKLLQILKEKNYTLKSIVPEGEKVFIKRSSCLAEGGEMRDVTDIVNSDIERICVKASKVVGRALAGIDVICDDISMKTDEQSFNIIEINGKPDLYIHYKPDHGKVRNVIKEIVEFMVESF